MIGIVVVAHGQLAREMARAVEHVLGKQEHLITIGVADNPSLQETKNEIMKAVAAVRVPQGVIICTELYGNSPFNAARLVCHETKTELIGGVNVPLLIQLMLLRQSCDLHETVRRAVGDGQKYMQRANDS